MHVVRIYFSIMLFSFFSLHRIFDDILKGMIAI